MLIGFESGSERILTNIQKKATLADNTRCMEIAKRHGLKVKALMSLGHPGETEETIRETRDWLRSVKPDDFDTTVITTYPGTPYFDEAEETSQGIWTYTYQKTGDRLHSVEVNYNETAEYAVPPTPALLGVGIIEDVRKCVTSDLKAEGELWIIGETKQEMGGSLYYRENGLDSDVVPQSDVKRFVKDMNALLDAIESEEVVACHDCSAGGMAIAVVEMCIGGARGAEITCLLYTSDAADE